MQTDNPRIPLDTLVDLLALETEKLTQLLSAKQFNEEYERTKQKIRELTAAIEGYKEVTVITSKPEFNDPDISS